MLNPHLTKPQGETVAAVQARTRPGQASWAIHEDKTCRECASWSCSPSYKRLKGSGDLKPRRCRMFPRLSQGLEGAGVEHDTPACRYFAPAEKPASISGRAKQAVASDE